MSENQNTDRELNELWFNLASAKFPDMTYDGMLTLRLVGATEWCFGHENEAATLFEQFIMMKELKDLKYEGEE